ncbi:hypothetical protein SAMN05660649_04238 [Desulfotomaculum arcticum]|uniref:Uncharacterized protein n=1 Tax=Desulfotruncus arcticus DSM 17038 TaxID=1121424 RepID=A0A1I2Y4V9_9FIRM|nr:hypothetical protein [Desulfotruncus arcticus]SFH20695.1 hypothetical protein SAMN05660649_04238 [Desulfotomaculum arcticum] [Desulfotruncus arcticus DSM 17038]
MKVKPIEIENKTIGEVLKELEKRLKSEDCYPEEYFDTLPSVDPEQKFPEYSWLVCYPSTGYEGHYILIEVANVDEIRKVALFGVTYQGFEFAAKAALACAKHLGA